jgi:hypothetical protein
MGISSYFGEIRGRQDQAGNMISQYLRFLIHAELPLRLYTEHIVNINAPDVPKEQRQSLYTNATQVC